MEPKIVRFCTVIVWLYFTGVEGTRECSKTLDDGTSSITVNIPIENASALDSEPKYTVDLGVQINDEPHNFLRITLASHERSTFEPWKHFQIDFRKRTGYNYRIFLELIKEIDWNVPLQDDQEHLETLSFAMECTTISSTQLFPVVVHFKRKYDKSYKSDGSLLYQPHLLNSESYKAHSIHKRQTDNTTWFTNLPFTVMIPKTASVQYQIYTAQANSSITQGAVVYQIMPSCLGQEYFSIGQNTGAIHVKQSLKADPQNTQQYTINVKAHVPESPSPPVYAFLTVVVQRNLNSPVFEVPSYASAIPDVSPIGRSILQVVASDDDGDEIRYSDGEGMPKEYFYIHPITGWLLVTRSLEQSPQRQFMFRVVAWDTFGRFSTAMVSIALVSQSRPSFQNLPHTIDILPTQPTYVKLFGAVATSTDAVGTIRYRIQHSCPNTDLFSINEQTGDVVIQQPLVKADPEKQSPYTIWIGAYDSGYPSLDAVNSLTVNVVWNTNSPVFLNNSGTYESTIPDNSPIGTLIMTVSAHDNDEGDMVTYSIVKGGPGDVARELFFMDGVSGHIYLRKNIQPSTESFYFFLIEATDNQSPQRSSVVPVEITIIPSQDTSTEADNKVTGTSTDCACGGVSTQRTDAPEKQNTAMIVVIVIETLLIILFIIFVIIIILRRRYKRKNKSPINSEEPRYTNPTFVREEPPNVYLDLGLAEDEIERTHLSVLLPISNGQFKTVNKAQMLGVYTERTWDFVVVKMLKENAPHTEKERMLNERQILGEITDNTHVIKYLGCCLKPEPPLIILEYFDGGNLQTHLQSIRYENSNTMVDSEKDLLKYAIDVSRGMQHISSLKVIHGYLATVNVLVGSANVCKICDFQHAKKLESSETVTVVKQDYAPVRWMAPESLVTNTFSLKSDVWSFGVLLWEILSYGATPYDNMDSNDIIRFVTNGQKMDKPGLCSVELYSMMCDCWATADDRPGFGFLRRRLESLAKDVKSEQENVKESDAHIYIDPDSI